MTVTTERLEYDEAVQEGETRPYKKWLAEEYDTTVISIGDIKVTDYDPGAAGASASAGEYSSQTWDLTIGDQKYRYERWYTNNSGGTEWYDEQGENIGGPGEFFVLGKPLAGGNQEAALNDVIDEIVDAAAEKYGTLYDERIQPLIAAIREEVFPFAAV